jgi:hypothetical protein
MWRSGKNKIQHKNFMQNPAIIPLDPTNADVKSMMDGWTDGGKYTLTVTYSANPPQMTVENSTEAETPAETDSPVEENPEQPGASKQKPAVAILMANAGGKK